MGEMKSYLAVVSFDDDELEDEHEAATAVHGILSEHLKDPDTTVYRIIPSE